jgi:glycosyltransferase involved in cell wall biosynthesis
VGKGRRVCIVRQQDVYEIGLRREAEALAAAGYDVEVICMEYHDRPRRSIINGVDVTGLPLRHRRSSKLRYIVDYLLFTGLAGLVVTWRQVRKPYAAVQINTLPDSLVLAAVVPKLLGARVILHMKEPAPELADVVLGDKHVVRALGYIERLAIRIPDRVITVTEALKQRYVALGGRADTVSIVLTGAPTEFHLSGASPELLHPEPTFTLISHGTIEERYGHDTLLEAVAMIRDELPDLRVLLTGRGSGVEPMLELVDRLNLGDIVRFEGMVTYERLNNLLASADVGIVSQKASDYSHLVHTNKMMDFWIFGLPVIHSRLRAVYDHYGDGPLEYYEPGNPEDLARAIRRVVDDPERRAQLVENGRVALEQNGWEVQRKIYLGVYEELLGER